MSTAPDFDSPEQSLPEGKALIGTKPETMMSPVPVQPQRDSFETIRLKEGRTLVGAIKMRIGTTVVIKTKEGKGLEINSSEIVSSVPLEEVSGWVYSLRGCECVKGAFR